MKRIFVLSMALAACLANPVSNVFEIDISPEEAQKYIDNPPFQEPLLSAKTATLPLVRWNDPRFRSGEGGPTNGHYWRNGHEIENTDDYVEDVYEASQFHGQDGLGKYAYGYSAPESSKIENRERNGNVKGTYSFKDSNDNLIQVRYWADSEGFHQEDNLPKVELQPAQETEEVRQARLAHEKAWQEAADAAKANPDPQGEYNPAQYEYESSASEQQNVVVDTRQGKAFAQQNQYSQQNLQNQQNQQNQFYQQNRATQYNQQNQVAQYSQPKQVSQYAQQNQAGAARNQYSQQQNSASQPEDPEPTGPPRGFFYSFNYPVSVLVAKNAQGHGQTQPQGHPIDHDTVGVSAEQHYG